MSNGEESSTETLLRVTLADTSDQSSHQYYPTVATIRTRKAHCPAAREARKMKIETSCDRYRKPVAKFVKKLQRLQIYNELDCYKGSHVKLLSDDLEKRAKAHISLWKSVEPEDQGRVPIMERIFGTKACKKMDYYLASGVRRSEIRRSDHDVKSSGKAAQDLGLELCP